MNTVTLGQPAVLEDEKLNKRTVAKELASLKKVKSTQTMEEKLEAFKHSVMDYALSFMETELQYAEVKEVKDVVSMVTMIEPKQQVESTNVNVLVQALQERFTDDV